MTIFLTPRFPSFPSVHSIFQIDYKRHRREMKESYNDEVGKVRWRRMAEGARRRPAVQTRRSERR